MTSLALRTKVGVLDRARAFEIQIERELSQMGSTGPGVKHALQLFAIYASSMQRQIVQSWDDAPGEQLQLANMKALNEHLRQRMIFFDDQFRRGHLAIPQALAAAVERVCEEMGVDHREAVLTVGPPMNFMTFIADLTKYLLDEIDVDVELPASLSNLNLILISVPELEGTRAAWQPVVIGHELAHYLQGQKPLPNPVRASDLLERSILDQTTDPLPSGTPPRSPRTRVLEQVANRWMNEIVCDAFAVHKFGAAGVAALAEFLDAVGTNDHIGESHPPGAFRVALMKEWLGDSLSSTEKKIVEPFLGLAAVAFPVDWATYLCKQFMSAAMDIWYAVGRWTESHAYGSLSRDAIVEELASLLASGVPGTQTVAIGDESELVEPADVVNAVWLAIHNQSTKPINRLALKALDTLDFLNRWRAAGGEEPTLTSAAESGQPGTLVEGDIANRLLRQESSKLVVTPLMPGAVKGASIDLRLGNKFVIFERSSAAAFDALNPEQDPRSMQKGIEKAWGDVFYLHPGELVLAATLEYMVLPGDLTAQVITRSSYGRLGLLSATAVQVHPHFAGCLTLELVNLGVMPMAITPGERVAQLVLSSTTSTLAEAESEIDKYRYPTGPEFSKITKDRESGVLGRMRTHFSSAQGNKTN